ncbi:FGGY-family carbohydrate kinase [Cellulomonas sp. Y8]|uniref:FGGY-family carbohydrate kinase n=1 Tax=Cellulomonas sp. Y8 TaxID=2591145 RepID=UPI003D7192B8
MPSTLRAPVACGVDVGSTNTKVVALDPDGSVVARASRPTPRDPRRLSVDARALLALVEDLVREACADRFAVHAVASAGVGEDGVLVDARLDPLTPALAWFDPRRQDVFAGLRPQLTDDATFDAESDAFRTLVGWTWARGQVAPGRAHRWVALADLAGVLWSGDAFLSDTLASRTGAWRSGDRRWASERVRLTLGDEGLLPPVVPTGTVVGPLRSAALAASGVLADGAVVVAGGHDHPVGGWAADRVQPGAVLDSMGTAEVVVAQSPLPPSPPRAHVEVAPGIRSGGSTLLRVEELARNVEWAAGDRDVAAHLQAVMAGLSEPLPVLDEGWFVPGSRGGGAPSWAPGAPRDPAVRASAVLGALAHLGRAAVEAVASRLTGGGAADPAPATLLAGGWVRSPGWVEIKARVGGARATPLLEPEVTAAGAALLAATARGWAPDPATTLGLSRR